MINRLLSALMSCGLAAMSLVAFPSASQAQEKLKWAHNYDVSTPYHKASVWAADEIRRMTAGKFDITVFPASSLGNEATLNESLLIGGIDILIGGPSFAARSYPRIGISYYPFIFNDADHLMRYSKSDLFNEMREEIKKKTGVHIAAYTYYGARHTTSSKQAFTTCAQMAGMKIRVPAAPAYTAMPRACGANPTPIAFAEVYLALQNKTVDGQENPLPTIQAMKFFEVQRAIMLTGHIVDGIITQVGPQVWRRLSESERSLFDRVLQEAAARATEEVKKEERDLVAFFKGRGLEVVEVDKESFRSTILKNVPVESLGFTRADYDRIRALR
jgi:tripartite ATP-independent transporter DctP family solute receptor